MSTLSNALGALSPATTTPALSQGKTPRHALLLDSDEALASDMSAAALFDDWEKERHFQVPLP